MERIREHWRTLVAALFSAVLIVGVYLLARGVESPPSVQASTESALLQTIATKDSDGDGLPDWEEVLYGADPRVTDSFHLGMTDGEAVSRGLVVPKAIADIQVATSTASIDSEAPPAENSLTAAFAKTFFSLYLAAKQANGGNDLSEMEMQKVASDSLQTLASSIAPAPDFKSGKDLTVRGSGADALRTFAASAEAVLLKNTANATTSEINYLKSAVLNDDSTAFTHIASISKTYRDSAIGLAVLPVPAELASDHLALVNALMRLSKITNDFTRANDDPLTTMLAIQQYPQASQDLGNVFIRIGKVYANAGISLVAGTPGASFVNVIKDIAAEQQSAKKP